MRNFTTLGQEAEELTVEVLDIVLKWVRNELTNQGLGDGLTALFKNYNITQQGTLIPFKQQMPEEGKPIILLRSSGVSRCYWKTECETGLAYWYDFPTQWCMGPVRTLELMENAFWAYIPEA